MKLTLQEPENRPEVQAGDMFNAEVISTNVKTKKRQDGEEYQRLNFKFAINEPGSAWDGQSFYGETGTQFIDHPDCRLRAWSQSIMGIDFPPGFELETDDLKGLSCVVVMGVREYTKDGEDKRYVFVSDVQPAARDAFTEPF